MRKPLTIGIASHDVRLAIEYGDEELAAAVRAILPPGHAPADPANAQVRFRLARGGQSGFVVSESGRALADVEELDEALAVLDGEMRLSIATGSPAMIFVHAGVVAHHGHGLLLPGASFSGKTELVRALLAQGATYYSDEFAVLDPDGRVHPYPRPLSVRDRATGAASRVPVELLRANAGTDPVAVRVIVVTRYAAGARWSPTTCSPATALMRLLAHSGQARLAPQRTLEALRRVVAEAVTLEGPRGEAEEAARALLALPELA